MGIQSTMIPHILLLLSIVHYGRMDESEVTQPFEIGGPKNFVALGGNDLAVRYRLSSFLFNLTTPFATLSSFSIQLTLLEEEGIERLIASETLTHPFSTSWQKVYFECGLVVKGGYYNIRLVQGSFGGGSNNDYDYVRNVDVLSNITIRAVYPTIDFEVPHRLESYTTSVPISFGLTKSLCKPKLPLPSTDLTLTICKHSDDEECTRDFAIIFHDPFIALEREGRVTVTVECHLWARNATYRVQILEKSTRHVIGRSQPIKVDWSSRFAVNMSKPSILPCRNSLRAIVSYPSCVIPGKDKIRVYGHETLTVPSLLAPNRLNYIGEQQIRANNRVVTFRCNLFPQRFSRFCFQYINTAVDDSVSVVVEKCIPTYPSHKFSDGGWGPWSSWGPCSATCGTEGRRFRYRFCDSPPPVSSADFCQGEAVEELPCDILTDCPPGESFYSSVLTTSSNQDPNFENPNYHPDPNSNTNNNKNNFHNSYEAHQSLNLNLSTTPGCECGCILYDLIPGINYTLVVIISSNQSSCADEDDEEHLKLKWILHAKEEQSRLRLDVVDIDVQCVAITFRDGNTTDSNLLEVITSTQYQYQPLQQLYEPMTVTVESTGASLSIGASDSNHNCSSQFIYLVAYYYAIPSPIQSPSQEVEDWMVYEFWTFLLLKLVLVFFIVVVLCSTFGGCATKVYRKYKYNELKWSENEDEEAFIGGVSGGGRNPDDDSSRCTSVTLMSFDYTYWKRLRILRLKYFLLKPRPLDRLNARVKSFPSTPIHPTRVKALTTNSSGINKKLTKSVSLSETNLRNTMSITMIKSGTEPKKRKKRLSSNAKKKEVMLETENIKLIVDDQTGTSTSMSMSTSLNGSVTAPSISPPMSENEKQNQKLQKEKENLKRKASEKEKKKLRSKKNLYKNTNEKQISTRSGGMTLGMILPKDQGKSQISVATIASIARLSNSTCDESRDRVDLEDADQDFEMDYYDYDVINAGNIPGSYLGLEPAFVLWNSEMYPHPDQEDQDNLTYNETDNFDMEMTASSSGLFPELNFSKRKITVKETSLDTLKYADDDGDDDYDDNATQASDSVFDNENDIMSDSDPRNINITV